MAFLVESFERIQKELSAHNVKLVAVTKTKPVADILEAYNAGHRDFAENYVQELLDKYEALPKDIRWHFIGHLQSNKAKYIAPFIHLIQGVDSEKLLSEINKQGAKIHRVIPCLLQVHISAEETKFGLDEHELDLLMKKMEMNTALWKNISVKGLMGMASFTEDNDLVRSEFKFLKTLFDKYAEFTMSNRAFSILSMGMSADYRFGIEAGSNMVRIGSLLFGTRN
ncbi:MAG: YggS family pyridoxal phosphate-dependent enzyme [Ferruginibacter sp.]